MPIRMSNGFCRKERKGRKERIGKMKELIMVLGCVALAVAVPQDAVADRSADWFPVSICMNEARQIPPFPCDNVAGLSLCLLSGEDCPVYGLQANVYTGGAERIYGCQAGLGINGTNELYGLQVSPVLNLARKLAGVQIGTVNLSVYGGGMQIGVYNHAKADWRGVQIGIMNYIDGSLILPLVNWRF